MSRVDFDADRADPLRFRLAGRDWEVPGSLPANVLIAVVDLNLDLRQLDLSPQTATVLARAALPLDDLVDAGVSMEDLLRILAWVLGEWAERGADLPNPAVT